MPTTAEPDPAEAQDAEEMQLLRDQLARDGRSLYAIGVLAGIPATTLGAFRSGKTGLSRVSLKKLAPVLHEKARYGLHEIEDAR